MRVEIISSAYDGKSIIASGQEQVNLYAEFNSIDPQAPAKITYYPTPGSKVYAENTEYIFNARGTYRTSIGTAYYVVNQNVYSVGIDNTLTVIGVIANRPSLVKMKDNGLVVILVDGVNGYIIDMVSNNFATITDPNFYGSDFVELLDTFFIFNRPDTNQFYISASNADFGMLTNTAITTGTIATPGVGYVNGAYLNVPLTGGSGTGATANITVGGSGVRTGTITTPGTLYTNGVYPNVPLTGGAGTGARATITVAGGAVTSVVPTVSGTGYVAGNTLSALAASIGGTGSGFVWTVNTLGGAVTLLTIANPGTGYSIVDVLSVNNASLGGAGSGLTWQVTGTASAFDPLDIAAKSGFNDPIVGIASVHRELWLIGNLTSEVWIGTGAADFYFQQQQGAYINHGCGAQYSIATIDTIVFFIMQDMQGNGLVVMGGNYETTEISTPRIVSEFKSYDTIEDAIGFCFQIGDHAFYCLVFPTANKGWMYDLTTKSWNEWNWCDLDGNLLRPRGNCCMFAFNKILVGDWENGKLLELSLNLYMDEDNPIVWIRTFPHMTNNNEKITYNEFDLDAQVGTVEDQEDDPQVSLSWSDDKGKSYGNPVMQSMGKTGDYMMVPSWNRLGQARDRVFKISGSANAKTAINGAFINFKRAKH